MGDFFQGWRRKVGLLTLLMACVFMAGWVRSLFMRDDFGFWHGSENTVLTTYPSGLLCVRRECGEQVAAPWNWTCRPQEADETAESIVLSEVLHAIEWRQQWFLIEVGVAKFDPITAMLKTVTNERHNREVIARFPRINRQTFLKIPYWSIVGTLTLISAYLLLIKPRKSTSKKITAPVPAESL